MQTIRTSGKNTLQAVVTS